MTQRTAGRIANVVAAVSLLLLAVSSVPPMRGPSSGHHNGGLTFTVHDDGAGFDPR
jgi:hypothetical protein